MKTRLCSTLLGVMFALLLSGCGSWVHKINVQQGNVLDKTAVDKVQTGMDRKQVQFLLGTPLIEDPFHRDRWDYVYYDKPGRGKVRRARVTVYFTDDHVSRIVKDLPSKSAAQEPSVAPG